MTINQQLDAGLTMTPKAFRTGKISLLALSCLGAGLVAAHAGEIDEKRIMQDISVLASDDFEGRAPNSPGEDKTIEYLERRFREIGLEPGGDLNPDGTRKWTQDVPLVQSVIDGPVDIQIAANGQPVCWTQGQEVAIRAARTGGGHIDISHAPMVFLGYGVFAPERNWDDFKGIDLNGKVGIVLVNDPDFETGSGDFEGKAMTYYGRWTYKYEEAARRGALGLLIIHETAPATYGWATVRNSNINAIYDIERPASSTPPVPLEGWIQKDTAVDLLAATGLSFEELKLAAQKRSFQPVELTGVDLSVKYALKRDKVITRNIVGLLPGKSHPDEYVMYTAHWDHLGVGQPDADGDSIYNGAVDNGTGVAVMLDIAQAFASGPRPERSILFASVSVEERGLLGSEYYVANPLYPLETTAAVINMDALGVFGPVKDFSIAGNAYSSLQSDLSSIGAKMGRSFVPDPKPEAGSFFRSDHFPFARVGVPAISFRSGRDLVNGGRGAGDKAWKSYVMERYHQPNDEVDDNWDASGLVADRDLMLALGRHIANSREWPGWDAGSEFKAERDKSDATRK